jgi:hypothetical protein
LSDCEAAGAAANSLFKRDIKVATTEGSFDPDCLSEAERSCGNKRTVGLTIGYHPFQASHAIIVTPAVLKTDNFSVKENISRRAEGLCARRHNEFISDRGIVRFVADITDLGTASQSGPCATVGKTVSAQ